MEIWMVANYEQREKGKANLQPQPSANFPPVANVQQSGQRRMELLRIQHVVEMQRPRNDDASQRLVVIQHMDRIHVIGLYHRRRR